MSYSRCNVTFTYTIKCLHETFAHRLIKNYSFLFKHSPHSTMFVVHNLSLKKTKISSLCNFKLSEI